MSMRGVRGATTVNSNSKEEILAATKELLSELVRANQLEIGEVASAVFTVSPDLNAEFPAVAAREIGWQDTPLLCAREIDVPGALPKCIRVLLHVNTDKPQTEIQHIYLRDAQKLRR